MAKKEQNTKEIAEEIALELSAMQAGKPALSSSSEKEANGAPVCPFCRCKGFMRIKGIPGVYQCRSCSSYFGPRYSCQFTKGQKGKHFSRAIKAIFTGFLLYFNKGTL